MTLTLEVGRYIKKYRDVSLILIISASAL